MENVSLSRFVQAYFDFDSVAYVLRLLPCVEDIAKRGETLGSVVVEGDAERAGRSDWSCDCLC